MSFNESVKKAKEEKLKFRIIRDLVFIFLGIVFLIISFLVSINKSNNIDKDNKKDEVSRFNSKIIILL